jgi:hypothetical protein
MKQLLLAALLMTTGDLEREWKATTNESRLAMITIIATYPDGRPVRGEIQCSGDWYKHEDGPDHLTVPSLPFVTDSRGAIIVNPHISDAWMICWCEQNGQAGRVSVSFDDADSTGAYHIVMGES